MAYIPELYYEYDVRLKIYGDRVEKVEYSSKIKTIKEEFNYLNTRTRYSKKEKGTGEIRRDSLHRSFMTLLDLAIMNHDQFKTFITLTFKDNITDITYANNEYKKWVTKVKRVFPELKILGVPEFQKRGAVHYHLLTNIDIETHSNIITLQKDKKNMYDVRYWNNGYTSVFDLRLTDEKFSVSLYLAKYFWKETDNRLFGHRKILYTRNLKKPVIEKFNKEEVEKIEKYLKGKKQQNEKTVLSKSEYGPRMLKISTFI